MSKKETKTSSMSMSLHSVPNSQCFWSDSSNNASRCADPFWQSVFLWSAESVSCLSRVTFHIRQAWVQPQGHSNTTALYCLLLPQKSITALKLSLVNLICVSKHQSHQSLISSGIFCKLETVVSYKKCHLSRLLTFRAASVCKNKIPLLGVFITWTFIWFIH